MMNICAQFHQHPSTEYEIAQREICVNGKRTDGRSDGIPENITPLATW